MVNEKYGIAMCETLQYLKGIDQNDLNKIPSKFMKFLNENCLKDYKCNFDYTKALKDLNISDEARGLIAMICLNYWCITEEQKEEFKKHLAENELRYQEELSKKYSQDNLFKNKVEKIIVEDTIETEMIEYNEHKWYQKLFVRLLNIFRKK